MRKLLMILFLFIGLSASAEEVVTYKEPIRIECNNSILELQIFIKPKFIIQKQSNGWAGIGTIYNIYRNSQLFRLGIKNGMTVYFYTDKEFTTKNIGTFVILVSGYVIKRDNNGIERRYPLIGIPD